MPDDDEARARLDATAAQGCDDDCAVTSAAEATKRARFSIVIVGWTLDANYTDKCVQPCCRYARQKDRPHSERAANRNAQKTCVRSTKNEATRMSRSPKAWDERLIEATNDAP
jgi:hypothetical protein